MYLPDLISRLDFFRSFVLSLFFSSTPDAKQRVRDCSILSILPIGKGEKKILSLGIVNTLPYLTYLPSFLSIYTSPTYILYLYLPIPILFFLTIQRPLNLSYRFLNPSSLPSSLPPSKFL